MSKKMILILDFGGQYNQLIARRVRESGVYCEIFPYNTEISKLKKFNPSGIIFTGGPNSVSDSDSPSIDKELLELNIPVLGICYGHQLIAHVLGGEVEKAKEKEYGKAEVSYNTSAEIFAGIPQKGIAWMSHSFKIKTLPTGFNSIGSTASCEFAAMENPEKKIYGVQFHPEVMHTENGIKILENFIYNICNCGNEWQMSKYMDAAIEDIQRKTGDGKILLALSGGVDSSVCAALLSKAVGSNLTCIFVDHGLMRKNEGDEIEAAFSNWEINFIRVNAQKRFLTALAGVTEPEKKRKIVGEEFIRVFEEEAKKLGKVDFLAQGTIYPDVIESGVGDAAVIKSHHNVGGLPDTVDFKEIIEPLRPLFKDEVRKLGRELNLPEYLVNRQPFPGPGLSIRVIGEVTQDKLEILREADFIFREEINLAGLDESINQYFAVLTSMRSVGVMGDERTYDYTVALRAVTTTDFMTAEFARIPYEVLEKSSTRIVNEVGHINRIVYDITSKPPATIEWE